MHTMNLVRKAKVGKSCSETILGTAVLENIVIRNEKKHSHHKVSYTYLGSPTQADHNSRRSQYLHAFFILFSCYSRGKLEKTLVTFSIQNSSLFIFSFHTKEQKNKKLKRKTPPTFL